MLGQFVEKLPLERSPALESHRTDKLCFSLFGKRSRNGRVHWEICRSIMNSISNICCQVRWIEFRLKGCKGVADTRNGLKKVASRLAVNFVHAISTNTMNRSMVLRIERLDWIRDDRCSHGAITEANSRTADRRRWGAKFAFTFQIVDFGIAANSLSSVNEFGWYCRIVSIKGHRRQAYSSSMIPFVWQTKQREREKLKGQIQFGVLLIQTIEAIEIQCDSANRTDSSMIELQSTRYCPFR